jgi:Rrf2 family protein
MKELTADAVLALHALHLMMIKTKAVSIHEIQQSSGFPLDRIRSVLDKLFRADLIRNYAGGRYVLAKAPGEVSVQHVVEAVSQLKRPSAPCGGDFEACSTRASCILAPLCQQAELGFQETLRSFTLAELMGIPPELPNCLDPRMKAS